MNVSQIVYFSSQLSSTTPPSVDPNNVHEKVKLVILVPLTVLIILSNLIILCFILLHKKLHKPTYLFVSSLGIADLFVGCISIATIVSPNDTILELCLVRIGFVISACVASIYCMSWIAFDRYIIIMYPLRYQQKMTFSRAFLGVASIWMISFLIGFSPLMGWNRGDYFCFCSVMYILGPDFLCFLFVTGFLIPMVLIAIAHCRLYRKAKVAWKRQIVCDVGGRSRGKRLSCRPDVTHRNWKSTRTVMILIGCYIITWCPFIVVAMVQILCGDNACQLKDIIGSYLLLLGFTNSFLNPIIYAASNKEFKTYFSKSVIKCWHVLFKK